MADIYAPSYVPEKYDQVFFREELETIAASLRKLESPVIRITSSSAAPDKPQEGDVYHANGTSWNPGSGAGLYEYVNGTWTKL